MQRITRGRPLPSMRLFYSLLQTAGAMGACGMLLTGCCWDVPRESTGFVTFQFDTDTTATGRGFRKQEVQSAYVVLYLGAGLTQPTDTMRQMPGNRTLNPNILTIFNNPPNSLQLSFREAGTGGYLSYRIVVPASQRSFDIADGALDLKENNDRCKSVYVQQIRFTLDGQPLERKPYGEPVVLSK
ncbi:hypothetical protein [Hymenobacter fodinae]|uniref:Lipoprotein n=1 Tax=Hymenobacter fodinae TaxID=2510796 RepID=A0A4Z0P6Y6_9BACT|nr:hypothetical protein [Hymenobacter fodinae]TGE07675.1 hypothetical protein EU556_07930 [Hymenobacter fodinae]